MAWTGKNLPLPFTREFTSFDNKTASCNGDSLRGCQERDTAYCRPLYAVAGTRVRLKRDGTRAETRFGLSGKRTSPFKSV
jgi:hypothetical protein